MRRATSRSRHTGMPCTARCSISRKTLRLAVFSGVGGAADGSVLPGNRPTRRVSRGPVGRDCRETSDSPCLPVSAGRDCRETFRLAVKPARGLRLPGNLPTRCQTCPRDRGVRREPSDSPCFPGSVRRDCRETFRLAVLLGGGRPDLAHGEGATAIRLALEGHRILDCRLARPAGTGLTAMAEADGI